MKVPTFLVIMVVWFGVENCIMSQPTTRQEKTSPGDQLEGVPLTTPRYTGDLAIERALFTRRSEREYKEAPLTLTDLSQLLWAAQGITDPSGLRTAPSAGALYPLEVTLVAGNVRDLSAGIYRYLCRDHRLKKVFPGDVRAELSRAALGQTWMRSAPAVVAISAVYERTTVKYGDRGVRYVHMEAGHAAQNIYLQAVSLNLGTVVVGAFDDKAVTRVLRLGRNEQPLCLMPVGRK